MNFLDDLNQPQQAAVQHTKGPVMVLAGAGSGKTRVLTFRIAFILNQGVDPYNILALTFTNKAAREMKNRIGMLVGEHLSKGLWVGTFHSIFARILRYESDRIGYPSSFTIYDTDDARNLIKSIIKELNLDDKVYKPAQVLRRISAAKNELITAEEYAADSAIQQDDLQAKKPLTGKIFAIYEARCFRAGAMDFDDLLVKMFYLLQNNADLLLKYQDKFRYIMVDEFQDTNRAQSEILKKLAARHENICVVGDDAQSIYAFRGANIQNILQFKKLYPDATIYKLEQNYRSTQNIVEAANQIIGRNKDQLKKKVWTSNESGSLIRLSKCLNEADEGNMIASEIIDMKAQNGCNEDAFAVLYRTNAQSRAIEESLRRKNIPYRIYGGISFYQRKEIKDLLAYFKLCVNPNDEEALKRVINYPARGIGQTSLEKIILAAAEEGRPVWDVLMNPASFNLGMNTGTLRKLEDFKNLILGFRVSADRKNAFESGQHIASSTGILKELFLDKTPEGVSRYENIQELLSGMKEFSEIPLSEEEEQLSNPRSLAAFIEDVALLTDVDLKDKADDAQPKVSLMTIHSAKGLEFPYVFIAGMEENLFPSQLTTHSRADLEEERRLFYVALTRAEKRAFLSYASTRFRYGSLEYSEPSRFLSEIPEALVDTPRRQPQSGRELTTGKDYRLTGHSGPRTLIKPEASRTPGPMINTNLKIGSRVEHDRFGVGEVVGLEGESGNQKATVNFTTVGKKQLLLKFARLNLID